MGAEVIAGIVERDGRVLKKPPIRLGPVYSPSPFAPELEKAYLPTVDSVVSGNGCRRMKALGSAIDNDAYQFIRVDYEETWHG